MVEHVSLNKILVSTTYSVWGKRKKTRGESAHEDKEDRGEEKDKGRVRVEIG